MFSKQLSNYLKSSKTERINVTDDVRFNDLLVSKTDPSDLNNKSNLSILMIEARFPRSGAFTNLHKELVRSRLLATICVIDPRDQFKVLLKRLGYYNVPLSSGYDKVWKWDGTIKMNKLSTLNSKINEIVFSEVGNMARIKYRPVLSIQDYDEIKVI